MTIPTLLKQELAYQQKQLKLIPSENYVSPAVFDALGSVLTNKYAEGYPGKRYYAGNRNIDAIEKLAVEKALEVFRLDPNEWHANVQAVTGSIANLVVYSAILKPGDKILSMKLASGGHLSHGYVRPDGQKVNFSSKIYNISNYSVSPNTFLLDYDEIEKIASKEKPCLIISGGTAYPRTIDHKKLGEIAQNVGAIYMADIAHEAGLIAGGSHPSPFPHADIVTMTTRKTLRGPIGSIIISRNTDHLPEKIDKAIFPGLQGGPMMNNIAAIAVALEETSTEKFKEYANQVVKNAQALSAELSRLGFEMITGGTDKHLILIDIKNKAKDGHVATETLEAADIILNKNTIPHDNGGSPWRPSGIRLGTPAVTTRGMKETEMKIIAGLIDDGLECDSPNDPGLEKIRKRVHELTEKFPIYA